MVFSRWFDGLVTGSKEEEYGKLMLWLNRDLSLLVIDDHHSDSSHSLSKDYLRPFSRIFGLEETENSTLIRTTSHVAS